MEQKLLIKDWIWQWLEKRRLYTKESTYALYQTNIRKHIMGYWGDIPMDEITGEQIQTFVRTIGSIIGHSNITTTLNLYVHPQMEEKIQCVESITKFFE